MCEPTSEAVAAPNQPVRACKCGAGPHATYPSLCAAGHMVTGNFMALRHALRSERLPPAFAHMAAEIAEFLDGSLTDDGGADQVPTRRRALHEYRARVHRRILQLDAAIEIRGLFDKRSKLRVTWLQQLQSLMTTAKSIDQLLGLARQPKQVPSLHDVMSGKAEL